MSEIKEDFKKPDV